MISNEKKYDTKCNECDCSKLTSSDSVWINISADLKLGFQRYCEAANVPMSDLLSLLIHKFLYGFFSYEAGFIDIYLDANLKKDFLTYCEAANMPMSLIVSMLIHKYLCEELFLDNEFKLF